MVAARALAVLLALAGPAGAQECRLALSLGLDVSSSVNTSEYRLQADGLADALADPGVVHAFLNAPGTRVALHIYEWSGVRQQEVVLDWSWIASEADLLRVSAAMRGRQRSFAQYPTAIGYAMAFGLRELERGPDCWRRTLDMSGDGENNDGFSPVLAKREFPFEGVTVNGLVIGEARATLRVYYESFVIHGPGAFVELASDHADFGRAMRRKLIREVGIQEVSGR